jgi:glycosyltransferase involved in cell wall biosynthesis
MIFFNEEKFLPEAIESVFAQTYENWELLLVDDGSTDASTKIARRCAEQNPGKVSYLEHEGHQNRGISASRNLGIRHAKGDYIALLDADDVWLPHKLEQQVVILNSQPEAVMLCGATQWWYGWTASTEDTKRDHIRALGVQPDTLVMPPKLLTLFLQNTNVPCPSNVLLKREIIEATGGFEDAIRDPYDDQAFYAKVCLKAPVFVAGDCWDKYRQHPDSCFAVAKKTKELHFAGLFYLNWLEAYLSAQRITNSELWRALRIRQWQYRHPTLYHLLVRLRRNFGRMKSPSGWMELFSRFVLLRGPGKFRAQKSV